MDTKGQLFSWDLAISITVFLVALMLVFYLWDSTVSEIRYSRIIYEMESLSVEVSEQLVRTTGVPSNWNTNNVSVIGLADQHPRVLNSTKILNFIYLMNDTGYDDHRYLLGIRAYDFYFNMTYLNHSQVYINNVSCFTGKNPYNESLSDSITTTRTSILGGKIVRTRLVIWKKEL